MKKKTKHAWRVVIVEIGLILMSLIVLLPILLAITMSLKSSGEVFSYPPTIFPNGIHFQNYLEVFQKVNMGRFLLNSFIIAITITVGKTLFGILSGYAFANFKFKGSSILFGLLFISLFMPAELLLIVPLFNLMRTLHWVNTYWALTIPFLASATSTFLMRQHFLTIPKELEDAAKIDGAGPMKFLFQILVPISKSMIGAVAAINFVYAWNLYLWPLVVTNSNDMKTVQIGLKMLMSNQSNNNWGIIMSGTLIALAPTLLLFFFVQKLFVKGLASSGLKE